MSQIFRSVEEAIDDRVQDIAERTGKMWAIWGSADNCIIILESGKPNMSESGVIRRSQIWGTDCDAYGENQGRSYKLGYNPDMGMYDFIGRISDATIDELYMVMYMARPEIINSPSFQNAVNGRLAVLEQTLGKEKVDIARQRIDKIFGYMKGAVKYNETIYFPAGYKKDDCKQ